MNKNETTLQRIIRVEILTLANELCEHLSTHQEDFFDDSSGFNNDEPVEVMQWWIVSEWLAIKLADVGEPVVSYLGLEFWGRTGCGYPLEIEDCLVKISEAIDSRHPG